MRLPLLFCLAWWSPTASTASNVRLRRSGGFPKFPPTRSPVGVALGVALGDALADAPGDGVELGVGGALCGTREIAHQPRRAGVPYPKIVGGAPVPYGAYPWQVEIQVREDDEVRAEDPLALQGAEGRRRARRWGGYAAEVGGGFRHHCGGAVVAPHLVVSAAHCLQGVEAERLRVVVGDHRLRAPDAHEKAFAVEQVLTHPHFRRAGPYSNDIGLLKVGSVLPVGGAAEWTLSSHVRAICLPEDAATATARGRPASPPPGAWCTVTGWGAQKGDDPDSLSEVLRAAAVPLLDSATCRNGSVYGGRSQRILDSMLCAGVAEGGVDACGGDSGGPLACELNGRFVLAGIVSWGDGCAKKNRPGVYTRISHYTKWIQSSMKKMGL